MSEYKQLIDDVVKKAISKGADEAEVFLETERESQVGTRMGEIETLKESISRGIGLRVFKGKRLGFVYSSDFNESHLDSIIAKALELASYTSVDEYNGLADHNGDIVDADLQLYDKKIAELPQAEKIEICRRMEKRMFDYDKRVTNSEGATFYDGNSEIYIANSYGLNKKLQGSYCYVQCVPIAMEDGKLQTGYWYSIKRHFDDLPGAETIAEKAAEKAIRMLGAQKGKTASVPVVFDQLSAATFISNVLMAVDGDAVYKKSTYLVDKLNQQVASEIVNIRDDALIPRAAASSPFDGEGLATSNKEIIGRGKLATYMYDTYTARKVGTKTTSNAQRGYSSTPTIGGFNFYLDKGEYSPEEIIGSINSGLYVTSLMGFGADITTGDYSQGASGMWIENGKLSHPVEGITIASNMLDILNRIEMIGNDLEFMGPASSPTFKVSEMIVAGG